MVVCNITKLECSDCCPACGSRVKVDKIECSKSKYESNIEDECTLHMVYRHNSNHNM